MSANFKVVANMTLWGEEVEFEFSTMKNGGYMGNITFPRKISIGDIMRKIWAEIVTDSEFPLGNIHLEIEQVMAVMKNSKDGKSSFVMFEILIEGVKLSVYFIKDNINQTESTLFLINPKNTVKVDSIPGVDVQLTDPISADISLSLCTEETQFTLGEKNYHYKKGFGFDCYISIPEVLQERFSYNPGNKNNQQEKASKDQVAPVVKKPKLVEASKQKKSDKGKDKTPLKWKKINKKLGRVATIHRIGIGYFDPNKLQEVTQTKKSLSKGKEDTKEIKKLVVQFDLTIHISKLHIGLIGLRLMVDPQKLIFGEKGKEAVNIEVLKKEKEKKAEEKNKLIEYAEGTYNRLKAAVSFDLDGLSIGMQTKTFAFAGLLAKQKIYIKDKQYEQFVGGLIVKVKSFSLSGIGAYGKIEGYTSFFLYAIADIPNIGPPAFTIQKVALGMGYNRQVRIPDIDSVGEFPLVQLALADADPDLDVVSTIAQMVPIITEVFPPKKDNFFFAVGIKFNSFKLLDGFVLLIISIGDKFRIDLLGLFIMSKPQNKPFVVLKIAIKATIIPEDGVIQIEGVIVDGSYMFSKRARLTGGFAFFTWTKDDPANGISAGDFVLTVGGYHPRYQKPKHYPDVPRFGLRWRVTDNFTIVAEAYFALTPAAFMAGGKLSAVYQSKKLDVWFEIYANFLIQWKPFAYDIEMGVSIGGEYRTLIKTYRFSLGAEIRIWGPEFAGVATIKIGIISKSVKFGDSDQPSKERIEWSEFKKELLPPDNDILNLSVTKGKQKENKSNNLTEVSPLEFELSIHSAIPVSNIQVSNYKNNDPEGFGIYPVKDSRNAYSEFKVEIEYTNKKGKVNSKCDFFDIEPIQKNLPAALWSTEEFLDLNTPNTILPLTVGVLIKAKSPKEENIKPITISKTPDFSEFTIKNAWDWKKPNCFKQERIKPFEPKNTFGFLHELFEEDLTNTDVSEFVIHKKLMTKDL